jgi:O-acetylhomoserine (thiol)-lyase
MQKSCDNAKALAEYLASHPRILKVNYPGLAEHHQHELAKTLFHSSVTSDTHACFGAILSFELAPNVDTRAFLNSLDIILRATHLGDTRTLALPVASTIFYENGPAKRAQMGISDTLIRLSVGIEDVVDLMNDFDEAFNTLNEV